MNNSFIIYNENLDSNLQIGLDIVDTSNTKSTSKSPHDIRYNPMYWKSCTHYFTIDNNYIYTNIQYTTGYSSNISIIDINGVLNPKFKIDGTSTASQIRNQLYQLIFKSFDAAHFNPSGIITEIIDNPYPNVYFNKNVTPQIKLSTTYRGILTEQMQHAIDNYKLEQEKKLQAFKAKQEFFKTTVQEYNITDDRFNDDLQIILESPLLNHQDFYNQIIVNHSKLNHDFINAVKSYFQLNNPKYKENIVWKQEIKNPCQYRTGVDVINKDFHSNFFYIYIDDKTLQRFFNRLRTGKTTTKYLFKYALGLLYINGKFKVNIDDIFYYMMIIIEKYMIQLDTHALVDSKDNEKTVGIEKMLADIKKLSEDENYTKSLSDIRAKTRNGCMFPVGWTDTMKSEWKENNKVERNDGKQRKDKGEKHMVIKTINNQSRVGMKYKKELNVELMTRILELRKDGKTLEEIGKEMGMNKMKVSRLLKKLE